MWCWSFKIASFLALSGVLAFCSEVIAQNQIVPDNTLGGENSTVKPNVDINGIKSDRLEGGARRGANLFHSFQNFNVSEGGRAYFANPTGIENILSRVTGGNASNILGTLGVMGEANLFLINPNGIIFGSNARLDVGGSFVVTTANGLQLGETGLFSATEPQTSNLLAIQPSALFFNVLADGEITNQSQAFDPGGETNLGGAPVGLQVPPDQTLALVGSNVVLEGGILTTAGGRIELGSVIGSGEVSLSQSGKSWEFEYDETNTFGNIRLQDGAIVDVSGSGNGDVHIQGARFEMKGSFLFADTLGSADGGEILVRTTEAVTLNDSSVLTGAVVGSGVGGSLRIETRQLTVRDGAQISTSTFGEGDGGALTIRATESVKLIGESADGQFASGLFTYTAEGMGDAGSLTLETGQLTVQGGARISAVTFGGGDGGALTIRAIESVELIGRAVDDQFPSGLFARTQGAGDAGSLTLETGQLTVQGGALISSSTFGEGDGGALTIRATESVKLIGESADGQFANGLFPNSLFTSGLFTRSEGAGAAGELTIETGQLTAQDGAEVTARSQGTGNAGSIIIDASDTLNANNANITTTATQSTGGAINITAGNISLRGDSNIRTNVFQGAGGGGNITIKADSIIAFDDSDIFTFSRDGRGGNIILDTPVFLAENFRLDTSDINLDLLDGNNRVDINASGAVSGAITLPDVSFIQNNLTELPQNPIDPTALLATSCIVRGDRARSSFTVTGSGGLPSRPEDTFVTPFPIGTIQTIPPKGESESAPNSNSSSGWWQEGAPIVEPTGVYRLPSGQLIISRECS